ncbi:hypothetical protein A2U01_0112849, partial [Trifolium medium]|nr:hypothetical protein [Trifolium medium]
SAGGNYISSPIQESQVSYSFTFTLSCISCALSDFDIGAPASTTPPPWIDCLDYCQPPAQRTIAGHHLF